MTQTIFINNKIYCVSHCGKEYTLTGARGAVYKTERNEKQPSFMVLYNAKRSSIPFAGLILTDINGFLEVAA